MLGEMGGIHKAGEGGDLVQGQVGVDQKVGDLFDADAGEKFGEGGAGDVGDALGERGLGDEEGPGHAAEGELFGGVGIDVAEDGVFLGNALFVVLFAPDGHHVPPVQNHQFDEFVGDIQLREGLGGGGAVGGLHAQFGAQLLRQKVDVVCLDGVQIGHRLHGQKLQQLGAVFFQTGYTLQNGVYVLVVVDDPHQLDGRGHLGDLRDGPGGDGHQHVGPDIIAHAADLNDALALFDVQKTGGLVDQRFGGCLNGLVVKRADRDRIVRVGKVLLKGYQSVQIVSPKPFMRVAERNRKDRPYTRDIRPVFL